MIINCYFSLFYTTIKLMPKQKEKSKKIYLIIGAILLLVVVFAGGMGLGYVLFKSKAENIPTKEAETEKDVYIEFLLEVYDKIQENYWQKTTDEELSNLFTLASEKITAMPQSLENKNKEGLKEMLTKIMENMEENQKKEFSATLAHIVLQNLQPLGRSGLYTQKEEENLQEKVQNVNPETGQVETTVYTKLVRPDILYLYIERMSLTTLDDLKTETEKFDEGEILDTLILDLRGNIGGSLDILLYLLGPFVGQNQYAFEFFHQGEYQPFKTKIGWLPSLVRYKKVVILIDENSQSSAEVMATTLKKYNVGILVGTKTKGWGTAEKLYKIENQISSDEKYSLFLVNSLTLREDYQPIEGNGIDPTININDSDWKKQLLAYFNDNNLIQAVEEIWNTSPGEI